MDSGSPVPQRNWLDYLWPLGGTVLGVIVFPVAIEQYSDFFGKNIWLLPLSSCFVVLCWMLPLLLHRRTQRIYLFVHEQLGLHYPRMALALVIAIGMLVGGTASGLGYILFKRHRAHVLDKQPAPSGVSVSATGNLEAPKSTTPAVVRVLYSSNQTIEASSVPGNHNDTLNLDNVATMTNLGSGNLDSIGLLLVTSPLAAIDKPKAGESYNAGDGVTFEFPAAGEPWIRIRGTQIVKARAKYVFDRFKSPIHVIPVGGRRFRVTLQSVRDKSSKKQKLIAYTFGISEE